MSLRVLTCLALVAGLFTPGAAREASVELGGGGLLPAPSDSRRLNTGWTAELALGSHGRAASETRVVLRQGVMESGGSTLYGFPPASSGSLRLYRDDPDVVRCTALEGVMRHSWGARWRIFVEGRSGLVWLGSHAIHNEPTNDRRPDPGQTLRHARGIGATTSVGTGLAVDLSRQLAFIVTGMACSATTDGVADPQFPIRGALEWTESAAAPAPADAGRHGMRFSLATGTSWLARPTAVRDVATRRPGWGVTLELPWTPAVSFVLRGTHQEFSSRERFILRQELDPLGNLVDVHAASGPLWAISSLQAGLQVQHAYRAWAPYARVAAGIARTGGQGSTVVDRAFVIDPNGNLVISESQRRLGFGDSRVGFAASLTLGVRRELGGSIAAIAEAGAESVEFGQGGVLTYPLSAGIVLR